MKLYPYLELTISARPRATGRGPERGGLSGNWGLRLWWLVGTACQRSQQGRAIALGFMVLPLIFSVLMGAREARTS